MTNADVAWYVEQMWEMHPMILNKLEMMEHELLAMEQHMSDMVALHQRELSTQRHLSLQREWQHRSTIIRMQKEMEEMKQTMLKMQEMLKIKSKRKNLRLETVVEDAEGKSCEEAQGKSDEEARGMGKSHEDAEGKSYEGNEEAEGMGKSYEEAEGKGNRYEMYAIGEVSK